MKDIRMSIREILSENELLNVNTFKFSTKENHGGHDQFKFNIDVDIDDKQTEADLDIEWGVSIKQNPHYHSSLDLAVVIKRVSGVIKYTKFDKEGEELTKELKVDSKKSNVEIVNEIEIKKGKEHQISADYIEVTYDEEKNYIEIKFL